MNYFKKGIIITLILAAVLFAGSLIIGRNAFFLILNGNLGTGADYLFEYFTYAGDGLIWIPVLLITLFVLKLRDAWVTIVSGFLFSTLFTQVCKNFILPDSPRPIKAIPDTSLIHTVKGVEVFSISSFPSGHTATAFTIYLLICYLINRKWWLYAGLLYALPVAYSRIYLAEHFPVDVAGGMVAGVVSAMLSIIIQKWYDHKRISISLK